MAESVRFFAQQVAQLLEGLHPQEHANLVTLSGDLGAGKTTFAQEVARTLGVEETVTSPTFVIEKVYQLQGQKWQRLIHIDAYRLKSAHELDVLGWKKLFAEPGNLILLEWPERVAELIPEDAIKIRFDIKNDERIITIDGEEDHN
jgi:tRNA threonylcarbamoyladenosine biosynthesis protein TsaE